MATSNVNESPDVCNKSPAAAGRTKHFSQLKHTETIVDSVLRPYCGDGPLLKFEASDAELIEHDLVNASDLPSRARGRQTHFFDGVEFRHARRMTDGRIALTISAGLVRQRDAGFMKLMAGLVMLID